MEDTVSQQEQGRALSSIECEDADRYIRQSNLNIIQNYYENSVDDPDEGVQDSTADVNSSKLVDDAELGPDMASMGLIFMDERPNESKDKANNNFENPSEEIPISDIDDEELDSYILSEKEVERKSALWNKVNAEYLVQQQEKEEKRLKEKEEGKPEKKRRRTISKKNRTLASTAGEAIEKMLQEKRISSKINYEVLKNLSIGSSCSSNNNQQQNDAESATTTTAPTITSELDGAISFNKPPMINSTSKIDNKVILPLKKSRSVKPNTGRPKNVNSTPQEEENEQLDAEEEINVPETSTYEIDSTEIVNENDDDLDEDVEPETTEMSLGQMLGRMHSSGYDEVEYDGEDY